MMAERVRDIGKRKHRARRRRAADPLAEATFRGLAVAAAGLLLLALAAVLALHGYR